MDVNERNLRINGLNIHYWEVGENQPRTLLLIHGGIGDAKLHWEAAMPALAEEFHILAPDLPGFGQSDLLPRMKTQEMLNWIKSFLDHQHIEQAVIIGSSLGGLLARLFAAANPTYVPAVIVVNGGGVPDMPGVMRLLERIPGISHAIFYLLGKTATSPGTLNRMVHDHRLLTENFLKTVRESSGCFSRLMRMFVGSPMPAAQAPLVPTLILWGADDQVATLQDAERIQASIPGATLTDIKDCGHLPQLETTDVFVWQIQNFLDRLSRPTTNHPGPGILPTLPS